MDELEILYRFAMVAGLGLIIGLQREHVDDPIAGLRTFTLVALAGATAAVLRDTPGGQWLLPAGAIGLMIALATGNLMSSQKRSISFSGNISEKASRDGESENTKSSDSESHKSEILRGHGFGQTTEIAALLTYLVGAQMIIGPPWIGAAVGGATAVLLHFKSSMEGFVRQLHDRDVRAVMQFVLLSLIVLPLLPDQTYGPYDVFNPRETWLMVVLIVGLNLAAYMTYKFVGNRGGAVLGGVLGGLISSTAATVSFSKQSGEQLTRGLAALAIMLASSVVIARILIELAVVARSTLEQAAVPVGVMLAFNLAICAGAYFFVNKDDQSEREPMGNPAQLKSALIFGALYAIIKLLVAFTEDKMGNDGLYLVALVSGLTDVDAITLSTGKLAEAGRISADTAWRVALTAALANLAFKGGISYFLGGWKLFRYVAILFGASMLAGIAIIVFWP